MYKTVRHGENSLQYTILPQEEGIGGVKPRKSRRKGKTAAILTVTVILICGIIATAVLVPLLLTSDFVVLPAAYQKFSVSTLRRSHSGNHMVVVAKKPHGWVSSHRNMNNSPHPFGSNKTHNSNNNNNNVNAAAKPQEDVVNTHAHSTTTVATTIPTVKTVKPTTTTETTTSTTVMSTAMEKTKKIMSNEIQANKAIDEDDDDKGTDDNAVKGYDEKYTEVPIGKNYLEISTTTRSSKGNDFLGDGVVRLLNADVQTTSSPWFQQRWSFGDTVSYVRWSRSNMRENFMPITVGSIIVLLCLVLIFMVWMRRRKHLRNDSIKHSIDAKADDKDTLLKETTAGSEEE